MNGKVILYLIGKILYFLGVVFAVPMFLGFGYQDDGGKIFAVCMMASFAVGFLFQKLGTKITEQYNLTNREGILTVVSTWLMAVCFSSVPFIAAGMLGPVDAFFEAMSGLTTTGATVLPDIEIWPRSLLFWRVWMHWIGGLGIIVIFIALLPRISGGAAHLFNAESSGFEGEKLLPRLQKTAQALFQIYIFITGCTAILLLFCGLDLYDAVVHAISAVGTGGFSSYNDSIVHFKSLSVEVVLGCAMFFAGGNFSLYFKVKRNGPGVLLKDDEFRCYLFMYLTLVTLVTVSLAAYGFSPFRGLREAFFQVASFVSTTGYVSADFDQWPTFPKLCLMLLYFTGACAGSTSGGIKISRFIVLARGVKEGVVKALHPQESRPILFNGHKIENSVFALVLSFFFTYIGIFVLVSIAVVSTGVDIQTAVTAVLACLSSIGPGFGPVVGATGNFAPLPSAAKLMLAFTMLLGRLEMYTLLILFHRKFWNGRSRW